MTTDGGGPDPTTALAAAARGRPVEGVPLPVAGALPAGLDGCFLQAQTHPAAAAPDDVVLTGPQIFSGVRLDARGATLCRTELPVDRGRPLGPVPALAAARWQGACPWTGTGGGPDRPGPTAFARPVPEADTSHWHTIATYPGLGHGEHLVAGPDGTVVHAASFALGAGPLRHAVAVTRRYVVILDSPVCYSQAAALVGARSPYVLQPNRPARVGLLPRSRTAQAEPLWLGLDRSAGCRCSVFDVVNAYDDGDRVVLDAIAWRVAEDGPGGGLHVTGRPRLLRWLIDPSAGSVRAMSLAGGVMAGTVDRRVSGRPHRFVFGVERDDGWGDAVVCHDLAAGTVRRTALGTGWRAGPPVFAPAGRGARAEGAGWILVVVWHAGHRWCELGVFDARHPAGRPEAVVRLPARFPHASRTTWVEADTPEGHGTVPGGTARRGHRNRCQ